MEVRPEREISEGGSVRAGRYVRNVREDDARKDNLREKWEVGNKRE